MIELQIGSRMSNNRRVYAVMLMVSGGVAFMIVDNLRTKKVAERMLSCLRRDWRQNKGCHSKILALIAKSMNWDLL